MATATKKKPTTKRTPNAKPRAARKKKERLNGETTLGMGPPTKVAVTMGNGKFDDKQKELPGIEEHRIPMIETCIKKIGNCVSERVRLKGEKEEAEDKLAGLLKKNKLSSYKFNGKQAVLEPGADVVKIKKLKDK